MLLERERTIHVYKSPIKALWIELVRFGLERLKFEQG